MGNGVSVDSSSSSTGTKTITATQPSGQQAQQNTQHTQQAMTAGKQTREFNLGDTWSSFTSDTQLTLAQIAARVDAEETAEADPKNSASQAQQEQAQAQTQSPPTKSPKKGEKQTGKKKQKRKDSKRNKKKKKNKGKEKTDQNNQNLSGEGTRVWEEQFQATCLQLFRTADVDTTGYLRAKDIWATLSDKCGLLGISPHVVARLQTVSSLEDDDMIRYEEYIPTLSRLIQRHAAGDAATDWFLITNGGTDGSPVYMHKGTGEMQHEVPAGLDESTHMETVTFEFITLSDGSELTTYMTEQGRVYMDWDAQVGKQRQVVVVERKRLGRGWQGKCKCKKERSRVSERE